MLDAIFQLFVAESPISVMVRALMESALAPDKIDGEIETEKLFELIVCLTYEGESLLARRIVLNLFKSTPNAEKEAILTGFPQLLHNSIGSAAVLKIFFSMLPKITSLKFKLWGIGKLHNSPFSLA